MHRPFTKPKHRAPMSKKKRFAYVIAPFSALLLGGAAFAYFALSTGTGSFSVANPNNFTISMGALQGAPLAPGNGVTQEIPFSISNTTNHSETLSTMNYSLVTNAQGDIYDTTSGAFIPNCLASYFSLIGGDGGVAMPTVFAAGSTMMPNGGLYLSMPADSADNESACENTTPEVQIAVS